MNDNAKKSVEESPSTKRWFPILREERELHEESFRLGENGYVLTLLSIKSQDDEEE